MKRINRQGFTLVEAAFSLAMMAIVAIAAVNLFHPIQTYFLRNTARQKTSMEARRAVDTISRELREGMANTVTICNCLNPDPFTYVGCSNTAVCNPNPLAASVAPPYSQIEFSLQGNTTFYAFYWAQGTVQMIREQNANGAPLGSPQYTKLADSVTNLNFTQSASDPAVIYVTLTSSAAYDASSSGREMTGVTIDKEEVHMLAQQ